MKKKHTHNRNALCLKPGAGVRRSKALATKLALGSGGLELVNFLLVSAGARNPKKSRDVVKLGFFKLDPTHSNEAA